MGRIQSDLGRIQSDLGRIQLGLGRIQPDWGRIQLGLSLGVKFQSIGALDIFNGGVKNPTGVLKGSMGALKKSGRVLCRVNGGIGGTEKGSMVALKRVNGALVRVNGGAALVRVNGGIEKGQWRRWSGSMGALVRVNGGIEKGQWALVRVKGGIEQLNNGGSMEVLKKINAGGHWSRSMGVLKRVNGSGSMRAWRRFRSDRGLALGQTGVLPYRVAISTLQGCKLYLTGL